MPRGRTAVDHELDALSAEQLRHVLLQYGEWLGSCVKDERLSKGTRHTLETCRDRLDELLAISAATNMDQSS